jgi:hypothetical protein
VSDIDKGEVLWIYPDQWMRSEHPDGFPLRVVDLLGPDGAHAGHEWIRGVALHRVTGLPVQEIVLKVPADQPRVRPPAYPT